jgi:hypothetical protein
MAPAAVEGNATVGKALARQARDALGHVVEPRRRQREMP